MNIFVRMELSIDYILLILLSVLPLVFVYGFFVWQRSSSDMILTFSKDSGTGSQSGGVLVCVLALLHGAVLAVQHGFSVLVQFQLRNHHL